MLFRSVPATGADAYSLASPGSAIGMRRAEPPTMTGIADSVSANRVADNGIQAKARRDAPVEVAQATAGGEQRGAMPASPAPALPASAGKLAAAAEAEKPMRQQAAVADQMESDARAGASVAARSASQPAAAPSRAESVAGAAAARPAEKTAKESSAAVEEMTRMPADKWIARIEELRQAGRLEEARAGLAEFRRRFPDYVLPTSLRDGILRQAVRWKRARGPSRHVNPSPLNVVRAAATPAFMTVTGKPSRPTRGRLRSGKKIGRAHV